MLSRVAERVYWMSRYLERAQNTARLVNVHTSLLLDLPEVEEVNWYTLIRIFDADYYYQRVYNKYGEVSIMQFMIADIDNPASLVNSITQLRENVRTSLDLLPEEIWEQVNQTYIEFQDAVPNLSNRHSRQAALRKVITGCQRIRGILDCHMSRDSAFDFMQVGKHIERADMHSRILEMTTDLLSDSRSDLLRRHEGILWTNLLEALGARQMYQKHMKPRVRGGDVMKFLLHDEKFPRSIEYSLKDISLYLRKLPEPEKSRRLNKALRKKLKLRKNIDIPVDQIRVFMDEIQADLGLIHNEIVISWFDPEVDAEPSEPSEPSEASEPPSQSQSQT